MRSALLFLALVTACAPPHPLPLPAPAGAGTSPGLLTLETELRGIIATEAPHDSLEVAVAILDLGTGDSLLIDGHTRMHAASTMKVPVMLELFRRSEAGELSLDSTIVVLNTFTSIADGSTYSLTPEDDSDRELYGMVGREVTTRELIERMITKSSNLATNLLIDLADPVRIAATLSEIGASEMHVLRGVEDTPAYERGLNNTTTAHGLARSLAGVVAGELVSEAATDEMIGILEGQEYREMIPSGLPPGTRAGNKTGWITAINHDGAVVFPEGREPYVIVVLTRGFHDREAAARVGRRISRRAWLYLVDESGF